MQKLVDYYRVLQVHHLAEPDVIESAYKRLAKRYHPDVSKDADAEQKMKLINEAYEVLIDPNQRKMYHLQWEEWHHRTPNDNVNLRNLTIDAKVEIPARMVLNKYLANIANKNFNCAYDLISASDKKKIGLEEFIHWQSTVAKIFTLKTYECRADSYEKDITINDYTYQEAVNFVVVINEYNAIMDRHGRDVFSKKVVLEKDGWRVYMGYQGLSPIISKFEELTNLLSAKAVINELVENYNGTDLLTGLPNQKSFLELAEKESWRYKRYGNQFSLMLCEIGNCKINKEKEVYEKAVVWLSKLLVENFRRLDTVARWDDSTFAILLPETDLDGGMKAARKIIKLLKIKKFFYNNKYYQIIPNFSVVEYVDSLERTIRQLLNCKTISQRLEGNVIVTGNGVYK
ncbi:MAG TPA: DnaJ domain-containing protein [Bacillota bacterium]|nr:DnaJ domain-containing protein [Bacillota bacterium]HOL11197.1 DnaJ domain-containing protein [Bacillota bacterium]HPO98802.1 DnaJ domain-containing protein [Bacillota bacterium]